MPVPVVGALYGVVGAISSGFTAVVGFFAARMTAKVAMVGTAVAVITTLTIALVTLFSALAASLSAALPPAALQFAQSFLPGNLNACVSVVIAAMVARWVYDRHVQIVAMFTGGN